ncbi:alpha/beta fold hydrolase [Nocardia pseudovaccinii]|uniref:alpha/beta fold hydrolase n=1 Tax=Nocardia pseudovaccinii TaxID=189540 RepID=UPI003D8B9935
MSVETPSQKIFETSEGPIHYHDLGGDGEPLLLIHGGGVGASGWSNFRGNVADLRDKFRLIIPDQLGFGSSPVPKDETGEYHAVSARTLIELLRGLGISKAHLVGNSLGGGVSLRMAMAAPDLVGRIILMGPYFKGFGMQLLAPVAHGNFLSRAYYDDPTPERMEQLIRTFVHDADALPNLKELVDERYKRTLEPGIEKGYRRQSVPGDPDPDTRSPEEKVRSIKHETLLLWGRDDNFCSLTEAFFFLTALENSELVVFRNTGHWVQVERQQEFASHVTAFLSR